MQGRWSASDIGLTRLKNLILKNDLFVIGVVFEMATLLDLSECCSAQASLNPHFGVRPVQVTFRLTDKTESGARGQQVPELPSQCIQLEL